MQKPTVTYSGEITTFRAGRFTYTVDDRVVLVHRSSKGHFDNAVAIYQYSDNDTAVESAYAMAYAQVNA